MERQKKTKSEKSRYHVPNLERALKILELLSKYPEGHTTSQLVEKLKIPRNSIFRITSTLLNYGFLIRDEETKEFQLSQKLLEMGYAALGEQSLVEKSLGVMRQLRDRFGETVPLGILHGNEGIVIEEVQGTHSFRFVLEPGRRFHLHTSAPGKAILAFLPENERESLINKIKFTRFNDRTINNPVKLRRVIGKVRQQGYAVDNAEETEGMHCVGAPILDRHGYPVAAIWITGPSVRVRKENFSKIGKEVRKYAEKISRSMGHGISISHAK